MKPHCPTLLNAFHPSPNHFEIPPQNLKTRSNHFTSRSLGMHAMNSSSLSVKIGCWLSLPALRMRSEEEERSVLYIELSERPLSQQPSSMCRAYYDLSSVPRKNVSRWTWRDGAAWLSSLLLGRPSLRPSHSPRWSSPRLRGFVDCSNWPSDSWLASFTAEWIALESASYYSVLFISPGWRACSLWLPITVSWRLFRFFNRLKRKTPKFTRVQTRGCNHSQPPAWKSSVLSTIFMFLNPKLR